MRFLAIACGEQFGRIDDCGRKQEADGVLGRADTAAHECQGIVHVLGDPELGIGHDQAEALGPFADVLDRLAAAAEKFDQLGSEAPAEDFDRAGRAFGRVRQRADLVGKPLQPFYGVAVAGAETFKSLVDVDDGLPATLAARSKQVHLAPELLKIDWQPAGRQSHP